MCALKWSKSLWLRSLIMTKFDKKSKQNSIHIIYFSYHQRIILNIRILKTSVSASVKLRTMMGPRQLSVHPQHNCQSVQCNSCLPHQTLSSCTNCAEASQSWLLWSIVQLDQGSIIHDSDTFQFWIWKCAHEW